MTAVEAPFPLGAYLERERGVIEAARDRLLDTLLAEAPGEVEEPIVYALDAGGKRLRPILCVAAYEQLTSQGIAARVVSMPSWELFEAQPEEYRHSVLPPSITARVAVEAAGQFGWDRYIGPTGRFVGMHSYGASAPGNACFKHYGITTEHVLAEAKAVIGN